MANYQYYAVVIAYDDDGSVKAEMPCFSYEEVMARAARYEVVRVLMEGQPPRRLMLKKNERDKYPVRNPDDIALEFLRDYGVEYEDSVPDNVSEHSGPHSDIFYDPWKGIKKGQF